MFLQAGLSIRVRIFCGFGAKTLPLNLCSIALLVVSIVSWRLVYAFIEKKECSKEEKTFG